MKSTKQKTVIIGCLCALGWRFLLAALIMSVLVICNVIKINLKNKDIKPLLSVAFFSPCIYYIAETVGISNTTASESGIFLACIPVVSLIASTILLKKKPSAFQIIGITITLTGKIVFDSNSISGNWLFDYCILLI